MNKVQREFLKRMIRDESEGLTERSIEFRKIAVKIRSERPGLAQILEKCSGLFDEAANLLGGREAPQ